MWWGGKKEEKEAIVRDGEETEQWMKEQQLNTSRVTYKVEGGKRMAEGDLPEQFTRESQKMNPCSREMAAVQKCLQYEGGQKCEVLLTVFNTCEERYFTKARVEAFGEKERKLGGTA